MSEYDDGIKDMVRELMFSMKGDILRSTDILNSDILQDKIDRVIPLPTIEQAEIILLSSKNVSYIDECIQKRARQTVINDMNSELFHRAKILHALEYGTSNIQDAYDIWEDL